MINSRRFMKSRRCVRFNDQLTEVGSQTAKLSGSDLYADTIDAFQIYCLIQTQRYSLLPCARPFNRYS